MRVKRIGWLTALTAILGLGLVASGCKKKEEKKEDKKEDKKETKEKEPPREEKIDPCPVKFKELKNVEPGKDVKCNCTAEAIKGSVWGDGIYTTDSSICAAAVHAGAIQKSGGTVTMKKAPGCKFYFGIAKNGVRSGRWGRFRSSFFFVGKGNGACAVAKDGGPCPPRFIHVANRAPGSKFNCVCGPRDTYGLLYGTGIYTADSYLCAAAVHTGAIPAAGGKITVQGAAGCSQYIASNQNGRLSGTWGAYTESFFFPGKGDGKCKELKQGDKCPPRFRDIPGVKQDTKWKCTCDASNMIGGVWGTGTYTADSSICMAALHIGAIKKKGGKVQAIAAPGCPAYTESAKNEVTSRKWANFSLSFYLKGKGKGKCK